MKLYNGDILTKYVIFERKKMLLLANTTYFVFKEN